MNPAPAPSPIQGTNSKPRGAAGVPDYVGSLEADAEGRAPIVGATNSRIQMPATNLDLPAKAKFGPGFQISTADDEYQLQFHNLTQFDYRGYLEGSQNPVRDTFVIPRQWFIFSGRVTKPYEYYLAIAEGFDTLNLLDVYLNIHYDDRLQLKLGRFKTPFPYEFYVEPVNGLMNPERSLFFNNFGLNRDLGVMAWGQLFEQKVEYASGIFNGTRNGFVDSNDEKDFVSYLDFRPFITQTDSPLENFHVGGSLDTGNQFSLPIPTVLRTNVATTGNLAVGPEFLTFNSNVRESGVRTFWSLHTAYYYQHLSLVAEWQSGYQSYSLVNTPADRTRIPVGSYYVQAGYFLTGETVAARGVLMPLRPFDLRKGRCGPGAIELAARVNLLNIGDEVFTKGLADPNLWTNRVWTVNVGVNWYWTQYIKTYFGWEHVEFGSPVLFAPGRLQDTSDMLWTRLQIYF